MYNNTQQQIVETIRYLKTCQRMLNLIGERALIVKIDTSSTHAFKYKTLDDAELKAVQQLETNVNKAIKENSCEYVEDLKKKIQEKDFSPQIKQNAIKTLEDVYSKLQQQNDKKVFESFIKICDDALPKIATQTPQFLSKIQAIQKQLNDLKEKKLQCINVLQICGLLQKKSDETLESYNIFDTENINNVINIANKTNLGLNLLNWMQTHIFQLNSQNKDSKYWSFLQKEAADLISGIVENVSNNKYEDAKADCNRINKLHLYFKTCSNSREKPNMLKMFQQIEPANEQSKLNFLRKKINDSFELIDDLSARHRHVAPELISYDFPFNSSQAGLFNDSLNQQITTINSSMKSKLLKMYNCDSPYHSHCVETMAQLNQYKEYVTKLEQQLRSDSTNESKVLLRENDVQENKKEETVNHFIRYKAKRLQKEQPKKVADIVIALAKEQPKKVANIVIALANVKLNNEIDQALKIITDKQDWNFGLKGKNIFSKIKLSNGKTRCVPSGVSLIQKKLLEAKKSKTMSEKTATLKYVANLAEQKTRGEKVGCITLPTKFFRTKDTVNWYQDFAKSIKGSSPGLK